MSMSGIGRRAGSANSQDLPPDGSNGGSRITALTAPLGAGACRLHAVVRKLLATCQKGMGTMSALQKVLALHKPHGDMRRVEIESCERAQGPIPSSR